MTDNFNYAHFDTSGGERDTVTKKFNLAALPEDLQKIRLSAFERSIPTASDETLCFLSTVIAAAKPENILEIGTAIGISGAVMLKICENAHLTTIEKNERLYSEALKTFSLLGLNERVSPVLGDGAAVMENLVSSGKTYDFIFLDGPKAQYVKYLASIKKLLKRGGVLFADDVLLFGWVTGEAPQKRKMLVQHIKEYINAVKSDSSFLTTVIDIGDGVALSVKIK